MTINGMRVSTSVFLTEQKVVARQGRDRWLSWPWRPWIRTAVIQIPSRQFLVFKDAVVCHPSMLAELRDALGPKGGGA